MATLRQYRKPIFNILLMTLIAASLTTTVSPDSIFSNMPASAPFYVGGGLGIVGGQADPAITSPEAVAIGFLSNARYLLDSISLAVTFLPEPRLQSPEGPLNIYFMADAAGLPGRVIESWSLAANEIPAWNVAADLLLTVAPDHRRIVLQPDDQYWVAAFPASSTVDAAWWLPSGALDQGSEAIMRGSYSPDSGTWFIPHPWAGDPPIVARTGLRVTGRPVSEPSAMLLLVTGLVALISALRADGS
jgi:hypothetical protein